MTDPTSNVVRKTNTLPTILHDASTSDVVLEQVFDKDSDDKDSNIQSLVCGKPLMTAKSILGVDFGTLKVDQISQLCSKSTSKIGRTTIMLPTILYNAWTGENKESIMHGGSPSRLKRKEEAMTRVADSMTEKFVAASKEPRDKRTEKMQLSVTIQYALN